MNSAWKLFLKYNIINFRCFQKIAIAFGQIWMIGQKMVQEVEVQAYQIQTTEYEKVKGAQNHSQNENSSNVIV